VRYGAALESHRSAADLSLEARGVTKTSARSRLTSRVEPIP
jgi:hypothetical protein